MEKKKFNWLNLVKIIGAIIAIIGVVSSMVFGTFFIINVKLFGFMSLPLFSWCVAAFGFIIFFFARYCQTTDMEKKEREEKLKQSYDQNQDAQQKKQPRHGMVAIIKKKELIGREMSVQKKKDAIASKKSKKGDLKNE